MRSLRVVAFITLAVIALAVSAVAAENAFGVADVSSITFNNPVRVGTSLLPAGNYTVRHTMEGADHVMVFKRAGANATEVKTKCTLVQLTKKSNQTQAVYEMDAANERVLRELVFRGDRAKHVF